MTFERVPVFPLNTVLFPGRRLPLRVFEPRYHALLDDILADGGSRSFVVAATADPEVGVDAKPARVGTVARVVQVSPPSDVRFLLAEGTTRVRLDRLDRARPFLRAGVTLLPEVEGDGAVAHAREVQCLLRRFHRVLECDADELQCDPTSLSYCVADALPLPLEARQALLELPTAGERLRAEARLVARLTPEFEKMVRAQSAPWN